MPTVLVSNDDLTVLGSPEVVELLVDIGPTGQRGSQIFAGIGDPNSIEIGQTPLLNDLYINLAPGQNYSFLYQYVSEPGGPTWIKLLKVNPTLYSKTNITTYVAGEAEIVIPISTITSTSGLTASNFNVQYSIAHINPTASSMTISEVVDNNLTINFKALEYDGGWSDLEAEVTTHLFISIVL